MKRLLAAGYPRIFQICKCFRRKERGTRHLPEFTMLEWYCAGTDYTYMMSQTEDLIRFVAYQIGVGNTLVYQDQMIDLSPSWNRMTVAEAFEAYATISLDQALSEDKFDEVLAFEIEPNLGKNKPLFLYDYPACLGALAKLKPDQPSIAERFELYMLGFEICNAFSELTNVHEQRFRFEKELAFRKKTGKLIYPMPEKFLASLPHMPEASGNALGIDRLVMLLTNSQQIDEVIAFTPEEL